MPTPSSRWSPTARTRAWASRSPRACPSPGRRGRPGRRARPRARARVHGPRSPGQAILGQKVDVVFIGSCTNGRISDLRLAAAASSRTAQSPTACALMVVPGSDEVKREAEREGLADIFKAAGADWREAGCSMCIAMNGDQLHARPVRGQHQQPQLRGSPGQGRPDVPGLAADRRRHRARRASSPIRGRCPAIESLGRGRGPLTADGRAVHDVHAARSSRSPPRTSTPTRSSRRATSR